MVNEPPERIPRWVCHMVGLTFGSGFGVIISNVGAGIALGVAAGVLLAAWESQRVD